MPFWKTRSPKLATPHSTGIPQEPLAIITQEEVQTKLNEQLGKMMQSSYPTLGIITDDKVLPSRHFQSAESVRRPTSFSTFAEKIDGVPQELLLKFQAKGTLSEVDTPPGYTGPSWI